MVSNPGITVGQEVLPLTVNTYRGSEMVFTIRIFNDWVVEPALYFPDQDITWTAEIVVGYPMAARWAQTADDVEDIPDGAVVQMIWNGRVIAVGNVNRKGY